MDSKTQLTVDIVAKVAQGKITINNATKLLNCSRRTIERHLSRYQKIGIQFVIHGNTGKSPSNKIDDELKRKVQTLIKEKYYDVNLQHLTELLFSQEKIDIKRETLRTWAHDIHHVKRAKKRRPKARKKRDRMAAAGLLMQMDGSPHCWFGNKKSCLIAIIDDATSELHAEFFPSETTQGCLKILRDLIKKKGLFKALYVDKAGIFGGPKRCHFSQVKRACEELGIEIIFANSPQRKGNGFRKVFQNWFRKSSSILLYKRLEREKFCFAFNKEQGAIEINSQELRAPLLIALLDEYCVARVSAMRIYHV